MRTGGKGYSCILFFFFKVSSTTPQHIKKQRYYYFPNKGPYSQSYSFSSSHVWMWELNWCFWTVVLEALESPLYCKEIKPVNPKGNQSWILIGRTDTDAEAPIFWPPDVNNWLIWKDPDTGKDWRQEEKGTTEDEMVGWHWWTWTSSGSWWWTGKPGLLQSMGLQRIGHDEQPNWTELK